MRKLFLFILISILCQVSNAQSVSLDKEKLLDYYQAQRYAEAAQYLQTVYPPDTKDVKALTQIGYCLMMAGKLPNAEIIYGKINELQPNTLPILFSLANINAKRGNKMMARFYFENIVKLDSNNFNAYKQLVNYTDSNALKITYLKKANTLNPTDADVAIDLAFAYRSFKEYEPAYETLKTAILADTNNFNLIQAQLPVANELKKYKEVVIAGERLLQTGADANVIKDVGKAYFFLKNYQKAISLLEMLEKMSMQNELTLYYTTLSYRELKNYPMATTYAKKIIDYAISPNTTTYYSVLGSIYETNNQLKNAVAAFKKGLTFSTERNIYYRLGLLYDLKLNQKQNALTYYHLYLKSNPSVKEDSAQIDYTKNRLLELKK